MTPAGLLKTAGLNGPGSCVEDNADVCPDGGSGLPPMQFRPRRYNEFFLRAGGVAACPADPKKENRQAGAEFVQLRKSSR